MMSNIYEVNGMYNKNSIKSKKFTSYEKALRYMDALINAYDVQIEDILNTEDGYTYVANDYSRFTLTTINA